MAKRVAAGGPVEGAWALPDGWRWERLGSFVSKSGKSVTPARTPDDIFQLYSVPSHPTGFPEIIVGREIGSAKQTVAVGDVLLCKINPRINRVWRVDDHGNGHLIASTEWIRFAADDDVEPDYLRYFLMRQEVRDYLAMNASGVGGSLMRVRPSVVETIPFPLPSKDRQRIIAARVDELFAEIDDGEAALARARDDLATWRKALLKAAVTGELTADWRAANPPVETGADLLANLILKKEASNRAKKSTQSDVEFRKGDLPALPLEWTWSTVGQIAHVTGGITKNAKRDALPLRLPYLRVGNVYAGRVDLTRMETIGVSEGEAERSAVKDGDLLIVEGNGSIDQIGRSAIWGGQIDPCLHQNHLIKVRFSDRRIAEWIQVWLQSPWGRKELEAQASSTSGLHTLSISKVAGLRCPVPPLEELNASLSMVQRLTAEEAAGGDDMSTLKSTAVALRQSILAAAFRGELA